MKTLFIAFCILHLTYIVVINFLGSYNSYNEFHHLQTDSRLAEKVATFYDKSFCKYYGRYTGAESGYGFFGINVRSNGILFAECNNTKYTPVFKSFETSLRFFSLANAVTDNLAKSNETTTTTTVPVNDFAGAYNNLVLKNIAITSAKKSACNDTAIALSYNLLNFPTLAQVRNGAPREYDLFKLITLEYSVK